MTTRRARARARGQERLERCVAAGRRAEQAAREPVRPQTEDAGSDKKSAQRAGTHSPRGTAPQGALGGRGVGNAQFRLGAVALSNQVYNATSNDSFDESDRYFSRNENTKATRGNPAATWPWEIELARSILALGASELFFLGAGFLLAERASSVAIFFRWGERAS